MSSELTKAKYIVVDGDGTTVSLGERQEDLFDDESDAVFRRVSWKDDSALEPRRGKAIDDMLRGYRPEIESSGIDDGYRLKIEVTVGDLRRLNVLAGLLQGEMRVRNPEIAKVFPKPDCNDRLSDGGRSE